MKTNTKSRGFTLLEVLIALGVLGVALGAITQSIGSTTSNIGHLRDKTFAHWVAMNQIAKLQATQQWPIRNDSGDDFMANHEWYWKQTVSKVEIPESIKLVAGAAAADIFQKVEVEVRLNKNSENPVARLSTIVSRPMSQK